jgi:hypothetical protein
MGFGFLHNSRLLTFLVTTLPAASISIIVSNSWQYKYCWLNPNSVADNYIFSKTTTYILMQMDEFSVVGSIHLSP